MALELLKVLRKGLKILKNRVKTKEALQARLGAEKKSTSSRDERWIDHNANLVDKQQVLEASENAPDHEHNIHNTSGAQCHNGCLIRLLFVSDTIQILFVN